mmetsp:Transcript_115926/g.368640  ORF Transcript_115926/g.368640 Transcript_115926/m.368640 type:complete len:722 (-) Transcript_115926:474-2639(-)
MSLVKGIYVDGELTVESWAIIRQYLRTWAAPDVTLVVTDWACMVFELSIGASGSAGAARTVSLLRVVRLARLVRLLGVLRMFKVFGALRDAVMGALSESAHFAMQTLGLSLLVIWIAHVVACAWFVIGKNGYEDSGSSWLVNSLSKNGDAAGIASASQLYQYLCAYHWALAQLSLGANDITASTPGERGFTVICMLLGLVGSSTLVSVLSSTMVELKTTQQEKQNKLRTLRCCLGESGVNPALACRVTNQVTKRLRIPKLLTADMVPALDLLSSSLLATLQASICMPHLLIKPMFQYFAMSDELWQASLCSRAIKIDSFSASDSLFQAGAPAEAAYVAVQGQMRYVQVPGSSSVAFTTEQLVDRDAWVSEAALWCHWLHVGTVECLSPCKVMTLDLAEFVKAVQKHRKFRAVVAEYSRQFTLRVSSAGPPSTSWPTDLSVALTDFGHLLWSMPKRVAAQVSLELVPFMRVDHSFFHRGNYPSRVLIDKASAEVAAHACVLAPDGPHSVIRVVAVIAFDLQSEDGKVLAQLGKIEDGVISACCTFPGAKRKQGESVEDGIPRILKTKFPELSKVVQVTGFRSEDSIARNDTLQVRTKYLKLVCAMQLTGAFAAPICRMPHKSVVDSLSKGRRSIFEAQATAVSRMDIDLSSLDVYFFGTKKHGSFCAWLEISMFQDLQSSAGSAFLSNQLSRIRFPNEDVSPFPSEGFADEGLFHEDIAQSI